MPSPFSTSTEAHASELVADLGECCRPTSDTALSTPAAERLAVVLKALGEPTRLRLVSLIAGHEAAEACVCDLTAPVGLSQPTVSHHLKILTEAGLLERAQRGKWAYYRLVPGALDELAAVIARAGVANPGSSARDRNPASESRTRAAEVVVSHPSDQTDAEEVQS